MQREAERLEREERKRREAEAAKGSDRKQVSDAGAGQKIRTPIDAKVEVSCAAGVAAFKADNLDRARFEFKNALFFDSDNAMARQYIDKLIPERAKRLRGREEQAGGQAITRSIETRSVESASKSETERIAARKETEESAKKEGADKASALQSERIRLWREEQGRLEAVTRGNDKSAEATRKDREMAPREKQAPAAIKAIEAPRKTDRPEAVLKADAEMDAKVKGFYEAGLAAFNENNLDRARFEFKKVLFFQSDNAQARQYIDKLIPEREGQLKKMGPD